MVFPQKIFTKKAVDKKVYFVYYFHYFGGRLNCIKGDKTLYTKLNECGGAPVTSKSPRAPKSLATPLELSLELSDSVTKSICIKTLRKKQN